MLAGWRDEPGEAAHQRERMKDDLSLPASHRTSEREPDALFFEHFDLSVGEWRSCHVATQLLFDVVSAAV
jgi:hypothetical protein